MKPGERIPLHDHSDRNSGGPVHAGPIIVASSGSSGGGGSGATTHNALSGVSSDQHHAQDHHARHEPGGADAISGSPVLYRLAFAWNTASISTGVTVCSVAAGDVIVGAWIDVGTVWNSTVSDAGDILTTTTSESLMNGIVNMQSVGSGTDRRKLRDGTLAYAEQSLALTAQVVKVKVTSVGISLSTGAATAFVLVHPL